MLKIFQAKRKMPAWVLLCAGLLSTVFITFQVKQVAEDNAKTQFSFNCDQVTLKISERLDAYALILQGAAAFVASSENVKRLEWKDYVDTLQSHESIPGLQGIGFAQIIPANQLSRHTADVQREGFPEYKVWPSGKRAVYSSVIYLEPFQDSNLRAFGYDVLTEPVRREGVEQARDTGKVTLTGKVELVQENGTDIQAGTLMYAPVYRSNMPKNTVAQRRTALIGWVSSPYRMNDLMSGILRNWQGQEGKGIELHIYDGLQAAPSSLLFDSNPGHNPASDSMFYQTRTIEFNGRPWLLEFDSRLSTSGIGYASTWMTLIVGIILSSLLFSLMLSLANTKSKAASIARKRTKAIRNGETALKESEYRWKYALEGSGDGVWDWDKENGKVYFSKRWKEMLGFSEDEIGNSLDEWEKRIHPEDHANTLFKVQRYLDGQTPTYSSEHRLYCKDGSYKWILDRGIVVSRDENGKALRLIGTHSDITERKKTELALRNSESFNTTVLNSLTEQIAVLDSQGVIVSVNNAWLEFARENGAPELPEQWIGINYIDICGASFTKSGNSDDRLAQAGIQAVLSDEKTNFKIEYTCHSPEEQRWFIMHVTPFKGTPHGVVVAHENITVRKLSEMAIQTSHERLEELALKLIDTQEKERKNIARELHDEMGQRFATLKINLHHMRQYLGNTGAENTWQLACEDVTAMIAQMRNISGALRPPMLDYLGLEVSISHLLQQSFAKTPTSYMLEYAGLPDKISEQLEITVYRIIQESITNIVRHADASHVIVEVNGGENASDIEIIIRDNGVGFDANHLDLSKNRSFGLVGMSERVKLLNGELHVSSTIGSGTRITALLPLKND